MKNKKIILMSIMVVMIFSLLPVISIDAKIKLNVTSTSLQIGKTKIIKLKGNKKSVEWSVSNQNIAMLSTSSKQAKIIALKRGTAYIKAKVGSNTYKCKITIKGKTNEENVYPSPKPESTPIPTNTPNISPTPTVDTKIVNKLLCEDENVSVVFKEVKNKKIIFTITNKSNIDFIYGNRYIILNGITYYDDFVVSDIFSKTKRDIKLSLYEDYEDYKEVDYLFDGGEISGRIYYYYYEGNERKEKDLIFDFKM